MADLSDKKVAILVHNYFEQAEFTGPKEALEEAGAEVTVVSCGEETVQGMNHAEVADEFPVDAQIDDVDFSEFDALVLPGGAVNADNLRMVQKARDWVNYCAQNTVPLAVICHAPWVLVSAGLADGLKLTSFYTIQDDIRNAGGDWVDEEVVIDGNIITSRNPDDIPAFNKALIELLTT
jgi:protease I